MGTTATGSVDPLHEILALRKKYNFRIHADAAYGGYFILVENLEPDTQKAFAAMGEADSIAIDPHKHGLQPYGCGCILFKDPGVGRWYKHNSPYTYFTSTDLHLGEISLECSRPGAAAAALWATQKLLPLTKRGEFAQGLAKSREAARALYDRLRADERFITPFAPELDLVIFALRTESVSATSVDFAANFRGCCQARFTSSLSRISRPFVSEPPNQHEAGSRHHHLLAFGSNETRHTSTGWTGFGTRILESVGEVEIPKTGISCRR